MAQLPLITRRDLLNHGAASDFLAQFDVLPIDVTIVVGGALGVATVAWRLHGDSTYSVARLSSAGASWTWDAPDPAWASVDFPAATYTAGDAWTIDTAGAITAQTGSHAVTATRYDLVALTCARVTSEIVQWMQPRVVAPVLSLGEGQKGGAADLAIYRLKSREGMTPAQAGTGDENLRARALDAEQNFRAIGRSDSRPPDITDSSTGNLGAGLPAMPASRSDRGFGDFS